MPQLPRIGWLQGSTKKVKRYGTVICFEHKKEPWGKKVLNGALALFTVTREEAGMSELSLKSLIQVAINDVHKTNDKPYPI